MGKLSKEIEQSGDHPLVALMKLHVHAWAVLDQQRCLRPASADDPEMMKDDSGRIRFRLSPEDPAYISSMNRPVYISVRQESDGTDITTRYVMGLTGSGQQIPSLDVYTSPDGYQDVTKSPNFASHVTLMQELFARVFKPLVVS